MNAMPDACCGISLDATLFFNVHISCGLGDRLFCCSLALGILLGGVANGKA
jgi:hypothetical protein